VRTPRAASPNAASARHDHGIAALILRARTRDERHDEHSRRNDPHSSLDVT